MNDINIMNQQQIARAFRVDRTTVRAWTKRGLPFIQGDKGKENQYHHGITMWWMLGDEFARDRALNLTAVQKIIYARHLATKIQPIEPDEDMASEEVMLDMLSVIGIPHDDVIRDVGFIRGLVTSLQHKSDRKRSHKRGK
ncbi:terminase small subunit [Salmonella enterica subsp. enterica]|nr:terminase small subunit [Salmonella enterica subsp. enterica]